MKKESSRALCDGQMERKTHIVILRALVGAKNKI